ncbi:MAG TPA: hypothetical protein VJ780_06095 [Flavobacterium sp.]|nr:hypothetical protein [Flavobacterium sp.]
MESKYKKLCLGLLFDFIGTLSFSIPFLGEFSDLIWAPISGFLLTKMYKGWTGRIGGMIGFVEEFFPVTDVIPTFTLTWIYCYLIKKEN